MEQQNTTPEKLTDKAFSHLMLVSFLAIFICVVCLCSTTYAWFTESLPSANNVVTTSECLLTVSVYADGATDPTEVIDAAHEATITEAGTYLITLTLPKDSSSGYLLVSASGGDHYVEHILRHTDDAAKTLSFTLVKTTDTAEVTLAPMWGVYSGNYDVLSGGTLTVD